MVKLTDISPLLFNILRFLLRASISGDTPPPLPILPIPNARQLKWQQESMSIFFHFGPNTFTDSEWGTGRADPSVFNPDRLNASQWIHVIKEAGFNKVIITAKHHDGFCLWPSEYTDYSVKSSLWKGGKGDVMKELAAAARESGIALGVYLSPWDRHDPRYGDTKLYNEFYMGQLRELLSDYGEIDEVFLDGAKGEGEKDMEYYFDSWFALIHQLQPSAAIFSDIGPDSRWVGDEQGVSGSTCWALFNSSDARIGDTDPQYLRTGDRYGHDWVPPECDVSIRPGWFWHASEAPKSASELLEVYYNSAGRNCKMLLNVPPNSSGLVSEVDAEALKRFGRLKEVIFSRNLAAGAVVRAGSVRGGVGNDQFAPANVVEEGIGTYWAPEEEGRWSLELTFDEMVSVNVVKVQEPIQMGQRIIRFRIEVLGGVGVWTEVASGTTVGFERLVRFPKVETLGLTFVVEDARAVPLVAFLGLYFDPFTVFNPLHDVM